MRSLPLQQNTRRGCLMDLRSCARLDNSPAWGTIIRSKHSKRSRQAQWQAVCMALNTQQQRERASLRRSRPRQPRPTINANLLWGDIVLITFSHLASDRVPKHQAGILTFVVLCCWIGVATAKGDYTIRSNRPDTVALLDAAWNMLAHIEQAVATWVLMVPTTLAAYAAMISHQMLDPLALTVLPGHRLAAESEVMFGLVFILTAWRAIYGSGLTGL